MPPRLDPFQAADKQALFEGRLQLSRLERIAAESMQTEDGEVALELRLFRDAGGKVHLRGMVGTRIQVICQRCMQPFWLEVHAEPDLVLLRQLRDTDTLDSNVEPLVVDEEGLDLLQLVDEELMLNLPIVATHPEGECQAVITSVGEDELIDAAQPAKENPFAILAALKDSNKHDQ